IVLESPIYLNNDFAQCEVEAGIQRCRLPEVLPQTDENNTPIFLTDVGNNVVGPIAAAIVDEDDLIRFVELLHRLDDARIESTDAMLFVIERNNDGVTNRFHDFHKSPRDLCN